MVKNNKKSIINTGVKACNAYGLTLNAIWIFTSFIYMYWFLKRKKTLIHINGKIINIIESNVCKKEDNEFSFLNILTREKSYCTIELEYNINNKTINKKLEHYNCSNFKVGGPIELLYHKDNDEIIINTKNKLYEKLYYIVLVLVIIIIIFTILRIFYSDNKWMKIYISLQCFLPG